MSISEAPDRNLYLSGQPLQGDRRGALGNYEGIVQTDGLQSYGSGEYLHAGCWSHARRKFVDSIPENDKNSKAAKAVEIINRAFALEREARKANVSPEKILDMRQKEVKPIIEEFYSFIGTLRPAKVHTLARRSPMP